MNKKIVISFSLAVIIIAGIFITNHLIGKKVAVSVDKQLQEMLRANEVNTTFQFEYDKVSANPLGRSVSISGFKVQGEDPFFIDMNAQRVKLTMPISEVLALSQRKELKSINKMSIDIQEPLFSSKDSEAKFLANSIKLAYEGEASLFEIERMDNGLLPSTQQSIDLYFKDMKWEGLEDVFASLPGQVQSTLGTNYNQSGDYRIKIDFDPYTKQINLHQLQIESKVASISAMAIFNFTGESFSDFEPKDGHVEVDYSLGKLTQSIPEMGEYSIKKAKASFALDLQFDKPFDTLMVDNLFSLTPIQNLNYRMSLQGLKLEPSENLNDIINQFGASIELQVFSMKEMSFDFEMKNGEMELNDLKLYIDKLIDLQGSLKLEYESLPNQGFLGEESEVLVFNNTHFEIEPKSEEMEGLIAEMEEAMPKPFPRKNGKIIIDISGPLLNPIIEGVTN